MNQPKPRRQRGVLLTATGWKKLQEALGEAETWENSGTRYSLEALSTRTSAAWRKLSDQLTTEPKVRGISLSTFCLLPPSFCLLALACSPARSLKFSVY